MKDEGKLIGTRIDRAENGFSVEHRHEHKPGEPFRDDKKHVFGDGHEMLRHIAKKHGIRFGEKRGKVRGGAR